MTRTYRYVIASKAKQSNDDPIRQLIHSMLFNPTILNGQSIRVVLIIPFLFAFRKCQKRLAFSKMEREINAQIFENRSNCNELLTMLRELYLLG